MSNLRDNLRDILARMKVHLGTYGGCDVEGTTSHAVKVSVNCHGHSHSVDILPSADILKYSMLNIIYLYVYIVKNGFLRMQLTI